MSRILYRLWQLVLAATILAATDIFVSCNTNGCLENRNSIPYAGFYASSPDPTVNGQAITLDSLRITGIGKADSVPLCREGQAVSALYMPMRSTQQSTSWLFEYKWQALDVPAMYDTLTFEYTSAPFFASDECGVIYKYDITHMYCTYHLIDSVVITDSLVTNIDKERIKIFFRTASPSDRSMNDALTCPAPPATNIRRL